MVELRGNLELGRLDMEGRSYVTVRVDGNGGPILYSSPNGKEFEVRFCFPGEDLGGRDPYKCLRLVPVLGGDDVILVGR